MQLRTRHTCRVCGSAALKPIMSLGDTYLSKFGHTRADFVDRPLPLDLVRCSPEDDENACGFVQLRHTTPYDLLYREYFYKSGVNRTMTEHLKGIVESITEVVDLAEGDIVVDIGCNDGTMLGFYPTTLTRVGFEPALNLREEVSALGISVIPDYFDHEDYLALYSQKARVVTSIAMFYDLDDPNAFVDSVRRVLREDGLWVIEMSYFPSMLAANAFDTVVHEHLGYYTIQVMDYLLRQHGFSILKVELNDINGGSFRLYCAHANAVGKYYEVDKSVHELSVKEFELALETDKPYQQFAARIERIRAQVRDFLETAVQEGKRAYVYGASTKGNSLLQYMGVSERLIVAAAERNPYKWGKYWRGPGMQVVSEEEARATKPEYFLVLPWHFKEEFLEREQEFLRRGGKFIFPLPEFQVIGWND